MIDRRIISLRIPTLGFGGIELEVSTVSGREAISELFSYRIVANHREQGQGGITAEDLLGQEAELVIHRNDTLVRRVYGMIFEVFDRLETEADYSTFELRLVPRAYRLELVEQNDILLDVDLPTLLEQKLTSAQLGSGKDFEIRLAGKYPRHELVVQYRETDMAFISRICEHQGVAYFFEHQSGRDVLVFVDLNESYPYVMAEKTVPYRPRGEHHEIYRFEEKLRMIPSHYVVRDYNYRNPQLALTGQSAFPEGKGLQSEYGVHVKTPDEATQLAMVRAEEQIVARRAFDGATDVERLVAGSRFVLSEHPMGDIRLLVTEVALEAAQSAYGAGTMSSEKVNFEQTFRAIHESVRFRPRRKTPKPRIHGVINAVVDADEKGHYAEMDDQGRYRIKFLFDTVTPDGKPASKYVRMAQPHAGAGYGFHFPLRPGIEVLVTFIDGDPDRPIITASVPNPLTPSPVDKNNAKRNVIRTGGGNEINIDDDSDGQRIKLHSPYASTTFQLGAKNAPEEGVALETNGAFSQFALGGAAQMSTWNQVMNMAQGTITSGNIVSSAGNPFAESATNIMTLIDLTKKAQGGLSAIAVSTVQRLKDKQAKEIEDAQKALDEIEAMLAEAISLRAAQMLAAANDPVAAAKIRAQLGLTPDQPLTTDVIESALKESIQARVAPYETLGSLGGSTARGPSPMTFGTAMVALAKNPGDEDAKSAIAALIQYLNELQKNAADSSLPEETRVALRKEIDAFGGLALAFQQEGGTTKPFAMPSSPTWSRNAQVYLSAWESVQQLVAEMAAHEKSVLENSNEIDPTSDASLLALMLAIMASRQEYERVKYESVNGEKARSIAQAENVLGTLRNTTDITLSVLLLYSTLNSMLGMLNESEEVDEVRTLWNNASGSLKASRHRKEDNKDVLALAVPNWMETLTGWPILFTTLLAGSVLPGASVVVQWMLSRKKRAFQAAVAETTNNRSKMISVNSPEPTFNILQSDGTTVVKGKHAAFVTGQVTVVFAQAAQGPPADSPPTGMLGSIVGTVTDLATKVTGLLRKTSKPLQTLLATAFTNTVNNDGTLALIGETKTIVASPKLVEIAGLEQVKVTSANHVDVLGEQKVDIVAGPRDTTDPPQITNSMWGMSVVASPGTVTAGHLKGDWKMEITDGTTQIGDLTAKRGMQSNTVATKVVHGTSSALTINDTSAALKVSASIDMEAQTVTLNGERVLIG